MSTNLLLRFSQRKTFYRNEIIPAYAGHALPLAAENSGRLQQADMENSLSNFNQWSYRPILKISLCTEQFYLLTLKIGLVIICNHIKNNKEVN